jgi:L-asparaginase/Glu-tRNA(Gln) amidotransferase subunit D
MNTKRKPVVLPPAFVVSAAVSPDYLRNLVAAAGGAALPDAAFTSSS